MFRLVAVGQDITDKSNNIAWGTDTGTLGAQVTFDSLYDIPEGTVISTVFDREDIRAVITDKVNNKFTYSYTALDFSFYLKNEVVKQFNAMPASEAIASLLGEYGIKCKCVSIPTPITKIYKDSLSAIIEDILSQATAEQGVEFVREMQADTLVIDKLKDKRIHPDVLVGADLAINSSISEMVNRVIVVSGSEGNVAVQAVAENKASIAKYGLLQVVKPLDDKDIAQASSIAANILVTGCIIKNTTTVPLLALSSGEQIKANRKIFLNAGQLNGWYKIKSAAHSLTDGQHRVSVGLEW